MSTAEVAEVRVTVIDDPYLSPEQVCELIPGMTKGNLAQLRTAGGGPASQKPTERVVVYRRSVVLAWVESRTYTRTDQPVTAGPDSARRIRAVA